jgi:FkbM family methyltransferase
LFESDNIEFLRSLVTPGSHILDIGANIGVMSIALAKMHQTTTIYCFEPCPLNYSLLNINSALNGTNNIITFNYALDAEPRFVPMYKNKLNYGDHRIFKPADEEPFDILAQKISAVNIHYFLKEALGEKCPTAFELIKIDAQGSDFKILESCLPLIKPSSTILIEYSPFHLYLNGTSKEQIERILDRFKIIRTLHHPNTIENINKSKILDDFDNLKTAGSYELILSELQHV